MENPDIKRLLWVFPFIVLCLVIARLAG